METLKTLGLVLLLTLSITASAQPAIQWSKCYGTSKYEAPSDMVAAWDGGHVLAGYSGDGPFGYDDFWIVKIDDTGKVVWDQFYGGSLAERCSGIIRLRGENQGDDGYLLVGISSSNDSMVTGNHGSGDVWIVKIDLMGNLVWQKCLGGTSYDIGVAAAQTTDGNIVVVSYTASNDGDVSGNHGSTDIWAVKVDQSGNLLWQRALGGTQVENAFAVKPTFDGGVILSGWTFSSDGDVTANNGSSDCWVVKLSSTGAKQWDKCLGTAGGDSGAFAVLQTSDTGYLVSAKTGLAMPGLTNTLIKLSKTGQTQWFDSNYIHPIVPVGGGYVGFGGVLKRIDDTAKMLWGKFLGGSGVNGGIHVLPTSDGGYLALYTTNSTDGDVVGNHGDFDYWVVKLAPDPLSIEKPETARPCAKLYPNPANGILFIQQASAGTVAEVYTITGKHIKSSQLSGINDQLDIRTFVPGLYFISFTEPGHLPYTVKFVKE